MIDVIVPVYRGIEQTRRCIESVLAAPQSNPHEVVVVHDASPEPEISAYVRELAAAGRVTLIENSENLGFVQSVNRGMSLHPDRDVVLLNSDAQVANDWLDRMRACAHSAADIATVTPFSNNATICSYPFEGWQGGVPGALGLAGLDGLFARVNRGLTVDLPTAVGFCMYIRRDSLERFGLFDAERFGKGYGEENDFCMRVAKGGLRNVLAADVFVYHEGAVSFTENRAALLDAAGKALLAAHPDYTEKVFAFMMEDPPAELRNGIDLARVDLGTGEARHVVTERAIERARLVRGLWGIERLAQERDSTIGQLNRALEHASFRLADRDAAIVQQAAELVAAKAHHEATLAQLREAQALAQSRLEELHRIWDSRSWRMLGVLSKAKRRILGGAS
jgi:GT2 family glycosyltransferase